MVGTVTSIYCCGESLPAGISTQSIVPTLEELIRGGITEHSLGQRCAIGTCPGRHQDVYDCKVLSLQIG